MRYVNSIYELLHIITVLETVDEDTNATKTYFEELLNNDTNTTPRTENRSVGNFLPSLIRPKSSQDSAQPSFLQVDGDFIHDLVYRDMEINTRLNIFKQEKEKLTKEIKIFNDTFKGLIETIKRNAGVAVGGKPTTTDVKTVVKTVAFGSNVTRIQPKPPSTPKPRVDNPRNSTSPKRPLYRSDVTRNDNRPFNRQSNRFLYRPVTAERSRLNLKYLIEHVYKAEQNLLDTLLKLLINKQSQEINIIINSINYNPNIPLFSRQLSLIDPRSNSTSSREQSFTRLPSIYYRGGTNLLYTNMSQNLKKFNMFFLENYSKLKMHVTKTNNTIKEQAKQEYKAYGRLSLFGKLTFVETSFFRLLKYAVERLLGVKEGRIDQIQDGFIGKIMYFFSLFSSFTGIAIPPLLTVIGLTAVELAIKTAIIAAGCKVLGILLATNIAIMIIFYIKKAIDKKRDRTLEAIDLSSPVNYDKQVGIKRLLRLIKPLSMQEADYINLKKNIKEFIFGSEENDIEPNNSNLNSDVNIVAPSETVTKFPEININEDIDKESFKTLILTTYTMIGNTEDPIGSASDLKSSSLDDIDKSRFTVPTNFDVNVLKKLTCSIVLNLDIADNDTSKFIEKINELAKTIKELKSINSPQEQKGGQLIFNKLMTYKLNDLKLYYTYKSGSYLDDFTKYKKKDIVKKIIQITKSN